MKYTTCVDTESIPWEGWWDVWKEQPEIGSAPGELVKPLKFKMVNEGED